MAQAAIEAMKKSAGDAPEKTQLTPTGKKETINGFAAEEYTCNMPGTRLSLWLTRACPTTKRRSRK